MTDRAKKNTTAAPQSVGGAACGPRVRLRSRSMGPDGLGTSPTFSRAGRGCVFSVEAIGGSAADFWVPEPTSTSSRRRPLSPTLRTTSSMPSAAALT